MWNHEKNVYLYWSNTTETCTVPIPPICSGSTPVWGIIVSDFISAEDLPFPHLSSSILFCATACFHFTLPVKWSVSRSVVPDSLLPHGLQPTRLLCPWDFPGKNTGVGCHVLLQGILLIQRANPHLLCLLHWQVGSLPLAPPGKPWMVSDNVLKKQIKVHIGHEADKIMSLRNDNMI